MKREIEEFLELLTKISKSEWISTETLNIKHLSEMLSELESNNKKLNEENIKIWLIKNRNIINNFSNRIIKTAFDLSSNSHSQDSINIGNNPNCEQISKMNQTIVSSFINVYDKLERKGDLKRLYQILGEIEFE